MTATVNPIICFRFRYALSVTTLVLFFYQVKQNVTIETVNIDLIAEGRIIMRMSHMSHTVVRRSKRPAGIRIDDKILENVSGGTEQEIYELKNALGVQGNGVGTRIEIENILYTKYSYFSSAPIPENV